jgi:hypothetical protein
MRLTQAICRMSLMITLALTGVNAAAQQSSQANQYAGNEARLLGRAYVYQAKPGMIPQFEAGVKRHMSWHQTQNDPWSWETWEIATGQAAGQYLIVTMPAWSELASWDAHFASAQAVNASTNILPYSEFQSVFYWVYRDDMSRPTPGSIGMLPRGWANPVGYGNEEQVAKSGMDEKLFRPAGLNSTRNLGSFYAASTGFAMVQLVNFQLRPEAQTEFIAAVHKIKDAMVKTNWQSGQGYFWYELGAGGDEPQFTLLLPKTSWTDITAPTGQMAELGGLFSGVLEAAYGKQEADSILQQLGKSVQRKWTDVVVKRKELSYTSPKAKPIVSSPAGTP